MATIIVNAYMIQYPLGAMMSWTYQYLTGIKKLGHNVFFIEKSPGKDSCFNPVENTMSDNSLYGINEVVALLKQADLANNWCFLDYHGNYFGMSKQQLQTVFEKADLYIDMAGGYGWEEERRLAKQTVVIDGEPGFRQIKRAKDLEENIPYPQFDHYYSVGYNVGRPGNLIPTGGITWKHIDDPVNTELFPVVPPPANASITTLMNWQSHGPVEYLGKTYGQKDMEFVKFIGLPENCNGTFELAVSGRNTPTELLISKGWNVIRAHDTTLSYSIFLDYIRRSKAEFAVCKNVFVALNTGAFSDRSAAYLASGRPVIMQDTGFSDHLPCGKGLFAVNNLEQAIAAIENVNLDWDYQSKAARKIALEFLDSNVVLNKFFQEINIK